MHGADSLSGGIRVCIFSVYVHNIYIGMLIGEVSLLNGVVCMKLVGCSHLCYVHAVCPKLARLFACVVVAH